MDHTPPKEAWHQEGYVGMYPPLHTSNENEYGVINHVHTNVRGELRQRDQPMYLHDTIDGCSSLQGLPQFVKSFVEFPDTIVGFAR